MYALSEKFYRILFYLPYSLSISYGWKCARSRLISLYKPLFTYITFKSNFAFFNSFLFEINSSINIKALLFKLVFVECNMPRHFHSSNHYLCLIQFYSMNLYINFAIPTYVRLNYFKFSILFYKNTSEHSSSSIYFYTILITLFFISVQENCVNCILTFKRVMLNVYH